MLDSRKISPSSRQAFDQARIFVIGAHKNPTQTLPIPSHLRDLLVLIRRYLSRIAVKSSESSHMREGPIISWKTRPFPTNRVVGRPSPHHDLSKMRILVKVACLRTVNDADRSITDLESSGEGHLRTLSRVRSIHYNSPMTPWCLQVLHKRQ